MSRKMDWIILFCAKTLFNVGQLNESTAVGDFNDSHVTYNCLSSHPLGKRTFTYHRDRHINGTVS